MAGSEGGEADTQYKTFVGGISWTMDDQALMDGALLRWGVAQGPRACWGRGGGRGAASIAGLSAHQRAACPGQRRCVRRPAQLEALAC
jgi:hypothetical protein